MPDVHYLYDSAKLHKMSVPSNKLDLFKTVAYLSNLANNEAACIHYLLVDIDFSQFQSIWFTVDKNKMDQSLFSAFFFSDLNLCDSATTTFKQIKAEYILRPEKNRVHHNYILLVFTVCLFFFLLISRLSTSLALPLYWSSSWPPSILYLHMFKWPSWSLDVFMVMLMTRALNYEQSTVSR